MIIPLVAALLQHAPATVQIPVGSTSVALNLGLPFNWKVLYSAALIFSLATLIFQASCPEIIRRHPDFEAFRSRGGAPSDLRRWFLLVAELAFFRYGDQLVTTPDGWIKVDAFLEAAQAPNTSDEDEVDARLLEADGEQVYNIPLSLIQRTSLRDEFLPEIFNVVYRTAAKAYVWRRVFVGLLYCGGILCLWYLLAQKITYVYSY